MPDCWPRAWAKVGANAPFRSTVGGGTSAQWENSGSNVGPITTLVAWETRLFKASHCSVLRKVSKQWGRHRSG